MVQPGSDMAENFGKPIASCKPAIDGMKSAILVIYGAMTSSRARLNPVQNLRQPLPTWVLPHHTPPQQCHAIMVAYSAMTSTH